MDKLDILLLPKRFYSKITDKKPTLYLGFLLVGIADLSVIYIDRFSRYFTGKPPLVSFYNITLAILLIILIGFIDVLFFSVPMFDLFKLFKKDANVRNKSFLIKLMKTYIVANVVIFLPINLIYYSILKNVNLTSANLANNYSLLFILGIFEFLPVVWMSAAISRGINVIYNFEPRLKNLVFTTIFTWSYILGMVNAFIIDKWAMLLFR